MEINNLMNPQNNLAPGKNFEEKILWIRKKSYYNRRNSLSCVKWGGSGHMGGAMSCAEILAVLYFWVARHKPEDPNWENRDRIILSKGHASPMLYAALSSAGYFPEEELRTFRQINGRLQGHPEYGTPGVEVPSGSLGLGVSAAFGISLGVKYRKTDEKIFAVIGDGELQEGQCWEVIMAAGVKKPGNFFLILDYNQIQQDGFVKNSLPLEPIEDKFISFGWRVLRCNGHDVYELINSFSKAFNGDNRPVVIIADTHKGFGVSYMKDEPKWHGTSPPNDEMYQLALDELKKKEEALI